MNTTPAPESALAGSPGTPAILALADGTVFRGRSIGATGQATAEVVFNTVAHRHQDPHRSVYMRAVCHTDLPAHQQRWRQPRTSNRAGVALVLIIRDLPAGGVHFALSNRSMAYLRDAGVVGIADIDTTKLTRILRDKGAQNGLHYYGWRYR